MAAGETAECQACFEDLPMNRQIHCNGNAAHFTCFDCAATYIRSEVGQSRCRVLCTAGCGAGFARAQLQLLSDKSLFDRLEQLQQEKEIRDAGLDNLEECPFCEYKAILPPVEEDFEFRCANPECEKVSCRRCKAVSHIPLSCEEHAKDNKLNTRHKIEEAMTAALIRSCNKCKKQFIKDHGCNKMTCPSCANLQCYVCSESLKDYNHFDQQPAGSHRAEQPTGRKKKCPLYDNVEERHEREVKEAEAAARAAAKAENPDVTDDDLQIKVSDAVKKATADRINRAGAGGMYPGAMHQGIAFPARPHHAHRRYAIGAADFDEDGDDEADLFGVYGGHAAQRHAGRPRREGEAEMRLALRQRLRDAARRDPRPHAPAPPPPPMQAPPEPVGAFGQLGPLQGVVPVYAPQRAVNNDLNFLHFVGNDLIGQNAQPRAMGGHDVFGQHAAGHHQAGAIPGGNVGPARPLEQLNNGPDAFLGVLDEDPFGGGYLDPFWPDLFLNNNNNVAAADNQQDPRQRAYARPNDLDEQIRQATERQQLALQRMHARLGGRGQVQELPHADPLHRHEPRGWTGQPQG
ncbi:hypothetical protein DOTSEDRAFT_74447 [Dothistroma septosporum NZE10]|uniref:RING-type domain-containing protein n=1 Tax=Dothistroma septosporum (strain NZE10 / CBS 128990) TaxID=675120 RepID=N1PEU6_DOTSN|nr:hypothetical protein DOTSEDRAFT_74447 [Dothistroma septosporum NZE10]